LLGQNSLLERDINKRESIVGRRRDSVSDRNSKAFDPKRAKGLVVPFEHTLQVMKVGLKIRFLYYRVLNM
jgi:hypothetical protein